MMDFKVKDSGEVGILTLAGELTIERAVELKEALSKSLDEVSQLVLNLEKTAKVDLSALQLLCSAHRTSIRLNKHLSLAGNLSEPFERTVEEAGFFRRKGCGLSPDKGCLWVGGNS
jgi:anti-anti-sigma factor